MPSANHQTCSGGCTSEGLSRLLRTYLLRDCGSVGAPAPGNGSSTRHSTAIALLPVHRGRNCKDLDSERFSARSVSARSRPKTDWTSRVKVRERLWYLPVLDGSSDGFLDGWFLALRSKTQFLDTRRHRHWRWRRQSASPEDRDRCSRPAGCLRYCVTTICSIREAACGSTRTHRKVPPHASPAPPTDETSPTNQPGGGLADDPGAPLLVCVSPSPQHASWIWSCAEPPKLQDARQVQTTCGECLTHLAS